MSYLSWKALHVLSMVLLFGTGLGSAFYKWMADRHGELAHMAVTNRHVVLADWVFTTPTVIFQPLSGLWMLHLMGWPWTTPWVLLSLALYAVAGLCWLPVVWMQIRMRQLTDAALAASVASPAAGGTEQSDHWRVEYRKLARWWFALGVPAFTAMVVVVVLMVFKHIPWGQS